MEPKELTPNTPTNHTAQDTIPDEARRKILGKLGTAAILVPVVTLISDASTNVRRRILTPVGQAAASRR